MFSALRPASRTLATRAFSSTAAASDVSRLTLVGRIGATPEVRQTKNGKDFLIYKVATNDPYRAPAEGEEPVEQTTSWHSVFAYGNAIERLQTLEKGSLVAVEATYTVSNSKLESGEYSTQVLLKHRSIDVIKRPYKPEGAEPASA